MKEIYYTNHLLFRLRLRKIPHKLPKFIYKKAKERYFDNETQKLVAIGKVKYIGKLREMAVIYEESRIAINLITIHPLKNEQKINRIKSRRWQKI